MAARIRRLSQSALFRRVKSSLPSADKHDSADRLAALVHQAAGRTLGLNHANAPNPWTPREMDLLEKLVSRVSSATIAKRLRRPESSVVNKLKRMGTSRRVRDGYTMRELELCLGEDHHKIAGWIKNGWLEDRLQGTCRHNENGNDVHRIREKDIFNFMRNYPQEINLGKADQTWFLDLVLLRGREVPEANLSHDADGEESDAAA
jgi:hypothetical protein